MAKPFQRGAKVSSLYEEDTWSVDVIFKICDVNHKYCLTKQKSPVFPILATTKKC